MGKSQKVKKANNRIPFYKEIMNEKVAKPTTRRKRQNRQENHEETVIDNKLTKKILTEAVKQLDDIEEEVGLSSLCDDLQTSHLYAGLSGENNACVKAYEKEFQHIDFQDESESNPMPEDLDRKALGDMMKEILTEKRTEINTLFSVAESLKEVDDKTLSIFKSIAKVLSMYRSGKIPKPFKVLPKLPNWEQLLDLTEPENWTAAAMFQATRIFASNLNCKMAEKFYKRILLPRVRDEIAQCNKLSTHLYEAVQKSVYKPRAFVSGIILPLCGSGTCTKNEATIITSVIKKSSIPSSHSYVALWHICEMEYSQPLCLFIRTLLEKKYALPFKLIDRVVDYFLSFSNGDESQPTLWHQCLLTFLKIYKHTLSQDQQQELLKLLKRQKHPKMTVDIRKELLSSVSQSTEMSDNSIN